MIASRFSTRALHAARSRRATIAIACCLLAVSVTGCKVGPDYTTPHADVPDAWMDVKGPKLEQAAAAERWWTTLGDPTLDTLVEQAIQQNLTLRQAGLRVLQSRALRGISVGEFFPQTQVVAGDVAHNQVSKNSPQGLGDRSFDTASIGLQAAWELDFWGKFRRGIESADAALEASVADYDAVLVVLCADVASSYVRIRSLQEQLRFTRDNAKSQQDTRDLTRVRFDAGAVSELDVSTAQATLSNTNALIPGLEDALRQTEMSLCVLLGRKPSDLTAELGEAKPVPEPPPQIAAGVPADLLHRRPDVRRAERAAAAMSAQVGVAKADFYPSITLSGSTGFSSSNYSVPAFSPRTTDLFNADSFQGFIGLGVNWPILNYGRIENNVRFADARYQEAIVGYQNTVLQAAAEVESSLSSFLRSRERAAFLAESVTAAQRVVELSLIQYRQGAADFLRVNQAQVDLVERQNSLVIARANVAQGAIATYRALGGGWEARVGQEFVPQETIDEMRARTNWGDMVAPASGAPTQDKESTHDHPQ